jgi:hypothetical protein
MGDEAQPIRRHFGTCECVREGDLAFKRRSLPNFG